MSSGAIAGRSGRRFLQFRVHGMDCAEEVAILRRRLGPFVVLTLLGVASLWTAIASDMGVSLLVVGNALPLLKTRA